MLVAAVFEPNRGQFYAPIEASPFETRFCIDMCVRMAATEGGPRNGYRAVITKNLTEAAQELGLTDRCDVARLKEIANDIENEINTRYGHIRSKYIDSVRDVARALTQPTGLYPEDSVFAELYDGRTSADKVITSAEKIASNVEHPRKIITRMFLAAILATTPDTEDVEAWRLKALDLATRIEATCYNRAIAISKSESNPPDRSWESPMFVNIYSCRCGTVAGLLDPRSLTNQSYGSNILGKLLTNEISPDDLGAIVPSEACPVAMEKEKEIIHRRLGQKVKVIESAMFKCPHCKARSCTYEEVHTRALDEPADFKCVCLNCGGKFKGTS